MIMDMSAATHLKALNRVFHAREAGAPEFCRLQLGTRRYPVKGRRSGSPGGTAYRALLLTALSLLFAGCATSRADKTARSSLSSPAQSSSSSVGISVPKQAEPPTRSVPLPSLPPQYEAEQALPLATATNGAKSFLVSSVPVPVRAREKVPVKAEAFRPDAPIVASSGAITDAPVRELIIKGTALEPHARFSIKKLMMWVGLGFGVAALAVVTRLCLIRRATPITLPDARKDDLITAPGLLLKESVTLP